MTKPLITKEQYERNKRYLDSVAKRRVSQLVNHNVTVRSYRLSEATNNLAKIRADNFNYEQHKANEENEENEQLN